MMNMWRCALLIGIALNLHAAEEEQFRTAYADAAFRFGLDEENFATFLATVDTLEVISPKQVYLVLNFSKIQLQKMQLEREYLRTGTWDYLLWGEKEEIIFPMLGSCSTCSMGTCGGCALKSGFAAVANGFFTVSGLCAGMIVLPPVVRSCYRCLYIQMPMEDAKYELEHCREQVLDKAENITAELGKLQEDPVFKACYLETIKSLPGRNINEQTQLISENS